MFNTAASTEMESATCPAAVRSQLQQLLLEVGELNEEQAIQVTNKLCRKMCGEQGSEEWLKNMTQLLADELTALNVDTPGLKIGEIMRKLQTQTP